MDTQSIDRIESLVESLSGELALLAPGEAEGLVPAYSLLSDLDDALEGLPQVLEPLQALKSELASQLEQNHLATPEIIAALTTFVETTQTVVRYLKAEIEVPWEELDWRSPAVAVAPAPASEPSQPIYDQDFSIESWEGASVEDNREILEEFCAESQEHLELIESALLELESDPSEREAISALFRSFHTIKGVAGFLDLSPIQTLAHHVESVLDLLRDDTISFSSALANLVLDSRDRLERCLSILLAFLENGQMSGESVPVADLVERADAMYQRAIDGKEQGESATLPLVAEMPAGFAEVRFLGDPSEPDEFDLEGPTEDSTPQAEQDLGFDAFTQGAAAKRAHSASIRINTEKLDSIVDAIGELVIVESQLRESLESGDASSAFVERILGQLGRVTRELQRTGLSLRMVPLRGMFQKMRRLVRNLALKSGKQVDFESEGEDAELDRNVVEEIGDPLIHMIRNAVDHGLEAPDERKAKGKPATGKIRLRAYYYGESIVIELQDDGRGVDRERVLQKAIERGIAQPDKQYSDSEIHDFLFEPGFSTAKTLTETSGRGVGLDVLRKNITKLRGSIEFSSVQNRGTTVRITLPLTLAIIDGLVLRVGNERYVLPIGSVLMSVKPKPGDIFSVVGKGRLLKHHGTLYTLLDLATYFGIKTNRKEATDAIVILVESEGYKFGLVVDELIHKQEVVVKKLGGYFANPEGISGGAVLGDGSVALVIDPASMGAWLREKRSA